MRSSEENSSIGQLIEPMLAGPKPKLLATGEDRGSLGCERRNRFPSILRSGMSEVQIASCPVAKAIGRSPHELFARQMSGFYAARIVNR
jgi:hypothetical protein